MKQDKKNYKFHLADLKKKSVGDISNSLHQDLLNKNNKRFWKSWKTKLGKVTKNCQTIDVLSGDVQISTIFVNSMRENCSPNDPAFHVASEERFSLKFNTYKIGRGASYRVESAHVEKIILKLDQNKSCGINGLIAEHLMYSDRCVVSILTYLFDFMLHFDVVPNVFGESLSFQIPKAPKSAFPKNS